MKTLYQQNTNLLLVALVATLAIGCTQQNFKKKANPPAAPEEIVVDDVAEDIVEDQQIEQQDSVDEQLNEQISIYYGVEDGIKKVYYAPKSLKVSANEDTPEMSVDRDFRRSRLRYLQLTASFDLHGKDKHAIENRLRNEFEAEVVTPLLTLDGQFSITADELELPEQQQLMTEDKLEVNLAAQRADQEMFDATRKTVRSLRNPDNEATELLLNFSTVVDDMDIEVSIALDYQCVRLQRGQFYFDTDLSGCSPLQ